MKYTLIFFIFFFLYRFSIYSQEFDAVPKTNLEIINEILQSYFDKCNEYLNILGSDKIYLLKGNESEEGKYILKSFKQFFLNYKFTTDETIKEIDYRIKLDNSEIKTDYEFKNNNLIFGKYIQREIFCGFNYIISNKDSILYKQKFFETKKDTIDYNYISYVESDNYNFSKGKIPEEGFWDKYLIPASAIIVSAIAIVLFFTIRSK